MAASRHQLLDSVITRGKEKSEELLVQFQYFVALAPEGDPMQSTFTPYRLVLEQTGTCFDLLLQRSVRFHAAYDKLKTLLVDCMEKFANVSPSGDYVKFAKRCQQDVTLLDRLAAKVTEAGEWCD